MSKNNCERPGIGERFKRWINDFGWARIIIALFLLFLYLIAGFFKVSRVATLNDMIARFAMNGILVLSMVPMIQSGTGLNFGVPIGIVGGLLAEAITMEYYLTGATGFFTACLLGVFFGGVFGWFYSLLLNRVKGDEMMIATYVGFSFIYFFQMMWVGLPFHNPASVQGYKGSGLRVTISLAKYWKHILDDFLHISIPMGLDYFGNEESIEIPVGTILFTLFFCLLVWIFFRSKTGTAMTAVGSNPDYAKAAGININRMRTYSVVMSSALAAIGIIVYAQSFGYAQYYTAPNGFTFPTVAAILLGGASITKANMLNVLLGAFLFQGVISLTPSVINSAIQLDISEVIRMIVTNGLIVYALTRKRGKK